VIRSIHLPVSYERSASTRDAIGAALDAGFRHITLGLPAEPYPAGAARWVAEEIIAPSAQRSDPRGADHRVTRANPFP
jgi:hypothetical protein